MDSSDTENRNTEDEKQKKNSQSNTEILDDSDENDASQQPVYQIRPQLFEKFKPLSAKEVIHNVLFDQLSTKVYDIAQAQTWAIQIGEIIRDKIRDMNSSKYKFVVNVVIGEQKGAGVKIGTRCIWDAEADSYAYDNYANETIFCIAAVYAIYLY